jgi:hypothetical protein
MRMCAVHVGVGHERLILFLWLMLVIGVLAWTLVSYHAQSDLQLQSEIIVRHALLMLLLTLPCGWLLMALAAAALSLAGVEAAGVNDAVLVSLIGALAGYFQWFVLMPWLWRRWKARRRYLAAPSSFRAVDLSEDVIPPRGRHRAIGSRFSFRVSRGFH